MAEEDLLLEARKAVLKTALEKRHDIHLVEHVELDDVQVIQVLNVELKWTIFIRINYIRNRLYEVVFATNRNIRSMNVKSYKCDSNIISTKEKSK